VLSTSGSVKAAMFAILCARIVFVIKLPFAFPYPDAFIMCPKTYHQTVRISGDAPGLQRNSISSGSSATNKQQIVLVLCSHRDYNFCPWGCPVDGNVTSCLRHLILFFSWRFASIKQNILKYTLLLYVSIWKLLSNWSFICSIATLDLLHQALAYRIQHDHVVGCTLLNKLSNIWYNPVYPVFSGYALL